MLSHVEKLRRLRAEIDKAFARSTPVKASRSTSKIFYDAERTAWSILERELR